MATVIVSGHNMTDEELEKRFKVIQTEQFDLQRKIKQEIGVKKGALQRKLLKNAESLKNIKLILSERKDKRELKVIEEQQKVLEAEQALELWKKQLEDTVEEKRERAKAAREKDVLRTSEASDLLRKICLTDQTYEEMLITAKTVMEMAKYKKAGDLITFYKSPEEVIIECGIFVNLQYKMGDRENNKIAEGIRKVPTRMTNNKLLNLNNLERRLNLFKTIFETQNWEFTEDNKHCITYVSKNTSFVHAVKRNLF